jgi:dihydrofolate reductase
MPIADRLYITHVHKKTLADIYFPVVDQQIWKVIEKEDFNNTDNEGIPYTYIIYERK